MIKTPTGNRLIVFHHPDSMLTNDRLSLEQVKVFPRSTDPRGLGHPGGASRIPRVIRHCLIRIGCYRVHGCLPQRNQSRSVRVYSRYLKGEQQLSLDVISLMQIVPAGFRADPTKHAGRRRGLQAHRPRPQVRGSAQHQFARVCFPLPGEFQEFPTPFIS